MCESLTHQHAIKRVAVYRWQCSQTTDTRFIQRQARHLVLYPLGRKIILWGVRQRQLANGVFHHRFPDRDDTQEDIITLDRECCHATWQATGRPH